MKHFIVEITYLIPADQLGDRLAEHRAYLKTGYDRGILLCSGPMNPRTGGILVARANDRSEIDEFIRGDPYARHAITSHRVIEFEPVLQQSFLVDWVAGHPVGQA
ncbi:MAG TPA: YciI family protein [Anaerolineaceae bacterium]|nr:YciI family protein [Anaerolineaceae bacterium]